MQVINGGSDGTTGFGGGFDYGQSVNFITDLAATVANTASPVVTSVIYTFVAGDVGAWVCITAGTSWTPGFYKIASVSAGAATLSAGIGAAQLLTKGLNTVAGCASVASPTVGTWSVDYSRQTTAQYSFTDLSAAGAGSTFTSALTPFTRNMMGNVMAISAGTNVTVQRAIITTVSAGGIATFDVAVTTGVATVGVAKLGGALATPGQAGAIAQNTSNGIWIKYNATAFSATSISNNVTNGKLTMIGGAAGVMSFVRGYETVCGDETANIPTYQWNINAASNSLITCPNNFSRIENLSLDGNNSVRTLTRAIAPIAALNGLIRKVKFKNFNSGVVSGFTGTGLVVVDCETANNVTTLCWGASSGSVAFYGCSFHDNSASPITLSTGTVTLGDCDFWNNTGATTVNVQMTGAGSVTASNVTMFNPSGATTSHGFDLQAGGRPSLFYNVVVQYMGGEAWRVGATATDVLVFINCAAYSNTAGTVYNAFSAASFANITNSTNIINFIKPIGDVFTNSTTGNGTLNSTASAGALLRAAGWPTSYAGLTGTAYLDIGAYQHQDTAGTAGMLYIPSLEGI